MSLTADDILGLNKPVLVEVDIPEWGGTIYVRRLAASDRYKLALAVERLGDRGPSDMPVLLVAMTACNESGELLYADNGVEVWGGVDGAVVDRLFNASMKLNATTEQEESDAVEKSEATP